MVIWIIGLAGSGKTTIGNEVYKLINENEPNTVLINGDEVRAIFKNDRNKGDYSLSGRKKNAERICEMCAWLDRQGINVICSILSIFEESRIWNKKTYSSYFEVYLDVSMDVLKERDQKGLYSGAETGTIKNVVGFDIPFQKPETPDMIIENNKETKDFLSFGNIIIKEIKKKKK